MVESKPERVFDRFGKVFDNAACSNTMGAHLVNKVYIRKAHINIRWDGDLKGFDTKAA